MLSLMSSRIFNWIHSNHLIYNTCWEDPRLDRQALQLTPKDTVVVITSAGCNALDYLLDRPEHIYAVDLNPRQNALLELKKAAIRTLEYEDFFNIFGMGATRNFSRLYKHIRIHLPDFARKYWDGRTYYFAPRRRHAGLYFHGTTGYFARALNMYIDKRRGLRDSVEEILEACSLERQRAIYYNGLKERFWCAPLRWAVQRDAVLAMVGVPQAQRKQVDSQCTGGVQEFVEDALESVFARLSLADNYFWRVYITGGYTRKCCPSYLKEENFQPLKDGLIDRVTTHTASVESFLRAHNGTISRFVLLDHQDWLSGKDNPALRAEWQAIVDRATADARVIWRSGGPNTPYVDAVEITRGKRRQQVGDMLAYHREAAARLHALDRVHTYGGFHIADILPA